MIENVNGSLTKRHRALRTHVLRQLRKAKMGEDLAYNVSVRLLNPNDYVVQQARPRVYIVGVRKGCLANRNLTFVWPEPIPQPPLAQILDARCYPLAPFHFQPEATN